MPRSGRLFGNGLLMVKHFLVRDVTEAAGSEGGSYYIQYDLTVEPSWQAYVRQERECVKNRAAGSEGGSCTGINDLTV